MMIQEVSQADGMLYVARRDSPELDGLMGNTDAYLFPSFAAPSPQYCHGLDLLSGNDRQKTTDSLLRNHVYFLLLFRED
jgi:hypothetical protein